MIEETDILKHSHPVPKKLASLIKLYQLVSPSATKKLALKLFFTPIKYPTPERELPYKNSCIISRELVNNKQITVYHGGQSKRKILLVHGWSGRASQFYKMAPALTSAGFKVYSFTAPAHGSSSDTETHMLEFADCIKYLDGYHGPFEAIIGHSLGAVATLNAIKNGVSTNKVVLLGAPGSVDGVLTDFCERLGFKGYVKQFLLNQLKTSYGEDYEKYGATRLVAEMDIPGLIIHDEIDADVDVAEARKNHDAWKDSEYLETKGLGHRLILSDESVINRIITFLK